MIGKRMANMDARVKGKAGGNAWLRLRRALILTLALGLPAGVATAQEREETVQNVQLVFHLVEADGFTDDDPEISDVVSELRRLFNFQGYRLLSTSVLNVGLAWTSTATVGGSGSQRIVADDSGTRLAIHADVSARHRTSNVVRAKVTLTEATAGIPTYQGRAGGPEDGARTPAMVLVGGVPGPLLEASVTIRDGQRVVLGSARRSAEDPVLILIVTPSLDPA
ncbi:MAG: hypothetical protein OXI39_15515 [Gemmatimonadota bacterium]|uniref:hypothetical protein n=1 Tax=Candidatus Palauibacter scopulicola TaxID=3056741 RepID=UPI00239FFFDB|nr:hypothetical protein [Candidatus Palauibacter scopulicola]MDE2664395.1 hypothetical protein [Candidatus Palauibacter scopulicola]